MFLKLSLKATFSIYLIPNVTEVSRERFNLAAKVLHVTKQDILSLTQTSMSYV